MREMLGIRNELCLGCVMIPCMCDLVNLNRRLSELGNQGFEEYGPQGGNQPPWCSTQDVKDNTITTTQINQGEIYNNTKTKTIDETSYKDANEGIDRLNMGTSDMVNEKLNENPDAAQEK